jgi:two-component system response regulator AtoC
VLLDDDDLTLRSALGRNRCAVERAYLRRALSLSGGNRTAAARLLGISYRSLMYKLKQYHEG